VRADPAGQDKGGGAAAAALHLVALAQVGRRQGKGIGFAPPDRFRMTGGKGTA
jgi:6,7-dimethyl-8-ribityllumazine synthase